MKQQSASWWKLPQAGQLSIPHERPALQSVSLSQSPSFLPHFSGKKLQQDPEYGSVAVHPKCKKRQIIVLEKMVRFGLSGPVDLAENVSIHHSYYGKIWILDPENPKIRIFESCNKVKIIIIANTLV